MTQEGRKYPKVSSRVAFRIKNLILFPSAAPNRVLFQLNSNHLGLVPVEKSMTTWENFPSDEIKSDEMTTGVP